MKNMYAIIRKSGLLFVLFFFLGSTKGMGQVIREDCFRTNEHPRIFATASDRLSIQKKIESVDWAKDIYRSLKADVDPIVRIHEKNPEYVISRMQMHWEPGKRYTRFYTEGNYIPRREGNAKYPTVRVTFGRAASHSAPMVPLDKIIPYGDGALTKPKGSATGIVKIAEGGESIFSQLGQSMQYDTVPFTKTGLGTETVNRGFIHLAWKSSILYYLTGDKKYAKLTADILWTFVRGAAQQEQVNPDWEQTKPGVCVNGYLSYETLGDTRHFATIPLAYDMIYDYLHQEYFDSDQFVKGRKGELWAPAHAEGKVWALKCFETMFKRLIENKLNRGGGLKGNWNMNEQQSAMLYALALDTDDSYADGKGRAYYVNKLIYGPTTPTHGAYVDVLHANVSPITGLWPEAPGGYGQGSTQQLVTFGFIYYKNGIDLLSKDPLLNKAARSMPLMLFPNGYVTNVGDASYSRMYTDQLELMLAYAQDKKDDTGMKQMASLLKFAPKRNLGGEFYYSLFFYLPEVPQTLESVSLSRTSYSSVYSLIFERNMSDEPKNSLAFTLAGYGKNMGHRQPNGMTMELYGRGHVLAPDQGIGADYWSRDTHEYKTNVAGHNTVSPNGKGADPNMPQELQIVCAEPAVVEGMDVKRSLSENHQFVEAANHFYTPEIKAEQLRLISIVRTSPKTGYFVDVFHSAVLDGKNQYQDYIYHNMGTGMELFTSEGLPLKMESTPLDTLSGKGYGFFQTLGSLNTDKNVRSDFHLNVDDTHMRMFMLGNEGRTVYQLNSMNNHRYYATSLKNVPVPALLVRQTGEAWDRPFVAVYEPYGNGADASVDRIYQEKTSQQKGVAKLTVELRDGRKDHIIHSADVNTEAIYRGIRFKGAYMVVSMKGLERPESIYIGHATSFHMKGMDITSVSRMPFDVYFEWKDGCFVYHTDAELSVKGKYRCIKETY